MFLVLSKEERYELQEHISSLLSTPTSKVAAHYQQFKAQAATIEHLLNERPRPMRQGSFVLLKVKAKQEPREEAGIKLPPQSYYYLSKKKPLGERENTLNMTVSNVIAKVQIYEDPTAVRILLERKAQVVDNIKSIFQIFFPSKMVNIEEIPFYKNN